MTVLKVKIDGQLTTLTYDSHSGARGHQYLTPGAGASHAFPDRLVVGQSFRTGGHHYEVMDPADLCGLCGGHGSRTSLDGMAFYPWMDNTYQCSDCKGTGLRARGDCDDECAVHAPGCDGFCDHSRSHRNACRVSP